jgi:hypothetical protein
MTARIVSTGEARGLLEGATPGPWSPIDRTANSALCATAPDLAHTVIALEGAHMEALTERAVFEARALAAEKERDAALARVARLERVLAVEAGDESQAPPDWRPTTGGAWNGKEDNYVYRIAAGRWSWVSRDTRNTVRGRGESSSALEAMEAADAAGEPR